MTLACVRQRLGRYGTPIPGRIKPPPPMAQVVRGPTGPRSSRTTTSAAMPAPAIRNLAGTPYQLSGAAGDLIDPIAQTMMKMFPEPTANMTKSDHL